MEAIHYSPKPPSAYTRFGAGGIGDWYKHRPSLWNLIWLSCPVVDMYLDAKYSSDAILQQLDIKYIGAVAATLPDITACPTPEIEEVLQQPIELFRAKFHLMPWRNTIAYSKYGQTWLNTVSERAGLEEVSGSNIVTLRKRKA
jgi:hypothetical protein